METRKDEMWQELIESTDFDQLSNAEKAFVLGLSTEKNYRLERNVLLESKGLYAEVEPKPLILEEKKKAIVIPLYQALIAVAAAFLLAFLLFRSNGNTSEIIQNQPLASADTVYVEKIVIDTVNVVHSKTEYVQLAAKQLKNEQARPISPCEKTSSVLSTQASFDADLSSTTLTNKGTSARNDATLVLLETWVSPN